MLPRRDMFDHRKEARKKLTAFTPVYSMQPKTLLGYLVDLTMHGAKVEGEHPLLVNQRITLGIEFSGDLPEVVPTPFTISARVARCSQEESAQYYNIGFQFTGITSRQAKTIEAIIQRYAFRQVSEE
jgi:hypothetical protein